MATDKPEVSKLDLGMTSDPPDRGPVLVNVHGQGAALRIRNAFGQIGEWNTTMRFNLSGNGAAGVQRILAMYAFRSDAGRLQVVALLQVFGNTFDTDPSSYLNAGVFGKWASQYVFHIYDVTADTHAEFALYRRTCEVDLRTINAQDVRPWGTSDAYDDKITPRGATSSEPAFMIEMQDCIIFGSKDAGVWSYRPSVFEQEEPQTGTVLLLGDRRGEGSPISPLNGDAGQFANYNYLPESSWPTPVDCAVYSDRLVIASGRSLYFSDPFNPRGLLSGNSVALPLQRDINAVATVFGNICVWTAEEFGIYRPNEGTFINDGSWRLVSNDAGCAGPSAKIVLQDGVIWAGSRGLFYSTGQYDVGSASESLQSLVIDGIGSPLSSFLSTQQVGYAPPTGDTPRLQWLWKEVERASFAYDRQRDMLLMSLPSEQIMLCRVAGQWSLFTTESRADNFPTSVNISSLAVERICSCDGRVFAACGPETFDPWLATGGPTSAWYLLEMGRGGAVDRSVEFPDDNRTGIGWWTIHGAVTDYDPEISLGKPTEIWPGWVVSGGGNAIGASGGWLVPVTIQTEASRFGTPVGYVQIDVTYDSTKWSPLLVGAGPGIDVVWPNERVATLAGWAITNPAPGKISITYNSATFLNLSLFLQQPLFYIPMQRNSTFAPNNGCGWGLANVPLVGQSILINTQARLRTWRQFDRLSKNALSGALLLHDDDDAAQPVDWVYKWAQMDLSGQGRLREVFLRALTHGQGTSGIATAWLWGLLNVYYSSDWKDWSGQIVDWSGFENELATKATPLRARVKDASAAMIARVFGGGLKWGSTADKTKGNYLADDEQVDTLAFSDSVRGETLSLLFFGFVRDKAETLMLREVTARVLKSGGRRRIGR